MESHATIAAMATIAANQALFMFAEINDGMSGLAPWANLAATTVIVLLFVWMLTVNIPARDKRNDDRQDAKDEAFLKALSERDQKFEKFTDAFREFITNDSRRG